MVTQQLDKAVFKRLARESIQSIFNELTRDGIWPRPAKSRELMMGRDYDYRKWLEVPQLNTFIYTIADDPKTTYLYGFAKDKISKESCFHLWEVLFRNVALETSGTEINSVAFNRVFDEYHKEIYMETARWTNIETLTGLKLPRDFINFDKSTRLVRIKESHLASLIGQVPSQRLLAARDFSGGHDGVAIVSSYTLNKHDYAGGSRPYPDNFDWIPRHVSALKAIRLLKNGNPRFNWHVEAHVSNFPLYDPFTYRSDNGEPHYYENEQPVGIDPSEISGLQKMWHFLMQGQTKEATATRQFDEISVAENRLNESYDGNSWIERVTNLTIGLEALLAPSSNHDELTHRLAMRAAWLLGTTDDESLRFYRLVKDMYKVRSSLVHGEVSREKQQAKWLTMLSGVKIDSNERFEFLKFVPQALDNARLPLKRAIVAAIYLKRAKSKSTPWPLPENFDEIMLRHEARLLWKKSAGITRSLSRRMK